MHLLDVIHCAGVLRRSEEVTMHFITKCKTVSLQLVSKLKMLLLTWTVQFHTFQIFVLFPVLTKTVHQRFLICLVVWNNSCRMDGKWCKTEYWALNLDLLKFKEFAVMLYSKFWRQWRKMWPVRKKILGKKIMLALSPSSQDLLFDLTCADNTDGPHVSEWTKARLIGSSEWTGSTNPLL